MKVLLKVIMLFFIVSILSNCGAAEIPTAPSVTEYTVTFDSQSATTPASPAVKTVFQPEFKKYQFSLI